MDVGCGTNHTVFVLSDGTVYSCGDAHNGQLGHEKATSKPGQLINPSLQEENNVSAGRRFL